MAIPALALQDCRLISQAFRRGCHYTPTEAATYAPLTANLQFMQSMSKLIEGQMEMDEQETLADLVGTAAGGALPVDLGAIEDKNQGFWSQIGGNLVPGTDSLGGIFDSECIPCNFSVSMAGGKIKFREERTKLLKQLNFKKALLDVGDDVLNIFKSWLNSMLSEIFAIIDMFKNLDKTMDICDFLKFLKEFICIPDLAKLLALLTMSLMDLAFELNAMMDLAFSLVASFILPLLTRILDMLMKYILMIIKPIECIIDSIQAMIAKLDYNAIFQAVPRLGQIESKDTAARLNIPFVGSFSIQDPDTDPLRRNPISAEFDLLGNVPGVPSTRATVLKEEERIRLAAKELEKVKKAALNVDIADAKAVEEHKAQEKKVVEEYREAVHNKKTSAVGRANEKLEQLQSTFRSVFFSLVNELRAICLKVDAWLRELVEEFKKWLMKYLGGSGSIINFSGRKLMIIQLIVMIKKVIEFFGQDLSCDGDSVEIVAAQISKQLSAYDASSINDAIDNLSLSYVKNPSATPLEKLKMLVQYTGDPAIDIPIAGAVESLVTPSKNIFDCRFRTSEEDTQNLRDIILGLDNE